MERAIKTTDINQPLYSTATRFWSACLGTDNQPSNCKRMQNTINVDSFGNNSPSIVWGK